MQRRKMTASDLIMPLLFFGFIGFFIFKAVIGSPDNSSNQPQPTVNVTDTAQSVQSTPAPSDSSSTYNIPVDTSTSAQPTYSQYYWYCWDGGSLSPHHLGHYVSGDHICSDQELHTAGMAGY